MQIWGIKLVNFLSLLVLIGSEHLTQWICQNLLAQRRQTKELIKTATLQEFIGECSHTV